VGLLRVSLGSGEGRRFVFWSRNVVSIVQQSGFVRKFRAVLFFPLSLSLSLCICVSVSMSVENPWGEVLGGKSDSGQKLVWRVMLCYDVSGFFCTCRSFAQRKSDSSKREIQSSSSHTSRVLWRTSPICVQHGLSRTASKRRSLDPWRTQQQTDSVWRWNWERERERERERIGSCGGEE